MPGFHQIGRPLGTRFESRNPATGRLIAEHDFHTDAEVDARLAAVASASGRLLQMPTSARAGALSSVADVLEHRRSELAMVVSEEMGKPIVQSEQEVDKCATTARWFAQHLEELLAPQVLDTPYDQAWVAFEPLGPVLAVMPWNFPLWQVFRQVIPALGVGNPVVLKHAENVPGCALAIEDVVRSSDFPDGVLQSLFIEIADVAGVVADDRIAAVTLTGSTRAGAAVAQIAAKNLKKQVLELGGSDPFIVLDDAPVARVVEEAVASRYLNGGQTCVSAKRFLVAAPLFGEFVERFADASRRLVVGDPLQRRTEVGPLARADLVDQIQAQVTASVEMGATIVAGGHAIEGPGHYFEPTVVTDVTQQMPVFREETFGPVAAVLAIDHDEQAVGFANESEYGLGASVWTTDIERGLRIAHGLAAGAVHINSRVSSVAAMPFGGVKRSGYGRELGAIGLREFANVKSVAVRNEP